MIGILGSLVLGVAATLMVITNYDPFPHHTLAIPTTTRALPTQTTPEPKRAGEP